MASFLTICNYLKAVTKKIVTTNYMMIKDVKKGKKRIKISLLQAVEAPRVARGQGSHITLTND
jgi:hypothetical protein